MSEAIFSFLSSLILPYAEQLEARLGTNRDHPEGNIGASERLRCPGVS